MGGGATITAHEHQGAWLRSHFLSNYLPRPVIDLLAPQAQKNISAIVSRPSRRRLWMLQISARHCCAINPHILPHHLAARLIRRIWPSLIHESRERIRRNEVYALHALWDYHDRLLSRTICYQPPMPAQINTPSENIRRRLDVAETPRHLCLAWRLPPSPRASPC